MVILDRYKVRKVIYDGQLIYVLSGFVYGHPRFPDGDNVIVSNPVDFNEDDNTIITTSGRTYYLKNADGKTSRIKTDIKRMIHLFWGKEPK